LRSYQDEELPIDATILQAALATSAATTFFDPVIIGARKFADGALGANNPVGQVEEEATNIWCSNKGELKPLVKCFVSIGTGNPGKKAIEDNIVKFLSNTLVGIATETEATEKNFIAKWRRHFENKRYFRFNVEQGFTRCRFGGVSRARGNRGGNVWISGPSEAEASGPRLCGELEAQAECLHR
jgi:predicted acylesterase/phospholipase RssA